MVRNIGGVTNSIAFQFLRYDVNGFALLQDEALRIRCWSLISYVMVCPKFSNRLPIRRFIIGNRDLLVVKRVRNSRIRRSRMGGNGGFACADSYFYNWVEEEGGEVGESDRVQTLDAFWRSPSWFWCYFVRIEPISQIFNLWRTYGRRNGRTDRWTDRHNFLKRCVNRIKEFFDNEHKLTKYNQLSWAQN